MRSGELRLFVSSTFRDLMPEREQLIKKVFPRLRAACRERGIEFTEIDLRWGITEEEASSGKLMRICVEEIDKCRPYIIGIVGSRYGFTPGADAITQDPLLFEERPWLREHVLSGKSITDVEFTHGMLNSRNTEHAFVYDQIHKTNIEETDKVSLSDLLARVKNVGIPLRSFASPEEFGEQVLADMLGVIERDFPIGERYTELALARQSHEAFALNRRRSHVIDPKYKISFDSFIASDGKPLVIWGRSGLGKSSLIASLVSSYRDENPNEYIVEHYVGAGANASDGTDVIRHILLEIKERYSLTDELPSEEHRLREEFPLWLAKVQSEKLILVIDALNQLTGVDGELHWLPDFIPANVRLIVSVTPGDSLDTLTKREWQMLEMSPLDEPMRERITTEYLLRYRKVLSREQLNTITKSERTSSPIFLRTLLEEIRIFGHFSELSSQIEYYLAAEDESQLFHAVLLRMEEDHGKELVRKVMTSIWASRFGLSENELLEITSLRRVELSIFLKALDYHLMQRGGLYTFFHNYLREGVEARYLPSEEEKKTAHAHLARYFASLEASERRSNEEPWQWIEAGKKEELLRMFADPDLFLYLGNPERHYELLGYWNRGNMNDEMGRVYEEMFEKAKSCFTKEEQATLFTQLGSLLTTTTKLDLAEKVLLESVEICNILYGGDNLTSANALGELATLYLQSSKYPNAVDTYQKASDIYKNLQDLKQLSEIQTNLAVVYYSQGEYEKAISLQRESLEESIKIYGDNHPIISDRLNNLASILLSIESYDEAEKLWIRAIVIDKRTRGVSHIQTIVHELNYATLKVRLGLYTDANDIYEMVLSTVLLTLGNKNKILADIRRAISGLFAKLGRFAEAEMNCIEAIEIRTELFGMNDERTIETYLVLADIKALAGNYKGSYDLYSKYYEIKKEKLGHNHPRVHKTARDFLGVLEKLGMSETMNKIYAEIPSLMPIKE